MNTAIALFEAPHAQQVLY